MDVDYEGDYYYLNSAEDLVNGLYFQHEPTFILDGYYYSTPECEGEDC